MASQRGPEWGLRQVAVVPQEVSVDEVPVSGWVPVLAARQGAPGIPVLAAYGTRFPATATFFDDAFLSTAKIYYDRAEALADNDTILKRVQQDRLSIVYLELSQLYSTRLRTGELPDRAYFENLTDQFETLVKRCLGERTWERRYSTFVEQLRESGRPAPAAEGLIAETDDGETVRLYKLGAEWRFRADPMIEGVEKQWFAADLNASDWGYVRTHAKGGLEKQGYPAFEGFGWYRQNIEVPADFAGKKLYLYFGAVDEDAWVYIDGKLAMSSIELTGLTPNEVWHTPFSKEVTDHLTPGQDHKFVVRFIDRSGMGGIWKPVYVVAAEAQLTTDEITELIENLNTENT